MAIYFLDNVQVDGLHSHFVFLIKFGFRKENVLAVTKQNNVLALTQQNNVNVRVKTKRDPQRSMLMISPHVRAMKDQTFPSTFFGKPM